MGRKKVDQVDKAVEAYIALDFDQRTLFDAQLAGYRRAQRETNPPPASAPRKRKSKAETQAEGA